MSHFRRAAMRTGAAKINKQRQQQTATTTTAALTMVHFMDLRTVRERPCRDLRRRRLGQRRDVDTTQRWRHGRFFGRFRWFRRRRRHGGGFWKDLETK